MGNLTPAPGLRNQTGVRTGLRVVGGLLALIGLGLLLTGGIDFFTLQGFEEPTRFWMLLVGIPVLGIGLMMLQLGFGGAGARYLSGEYASVAKDTATYLTDGKGLLNVGVRDGDEPGSGPYCRSCGTRHEADARFCVACGTAIT